jgi:group I intron endonuclease
MNKISGVYKILNKVNGKFYIGSSKDIHKRWLTHLSCLRRNKQPNRYLQFAFNKYREENFKLEIIENVLDKNNLIKREEYWINELKSYNHSIGYNINRIVNERVEFSQETIDKMSIARTGKKLTLEHRLNISKAGKGKKRSEETKHKMSLSFKGRKWSEKAKYNNFIAQCRGQNYKLFNPTGEIVEFISVNKLCRDNNLDVRTIGKLLNLKTTTYCHHGWTNPNKKCISKRGENWIKNMSKSKLIKELRCL